MLHRFALPLAIVLAAGCGPPAAEVGGEMPKKIFTRIVSLSPSTTELVALLNQESRLMGRTASCNRPDTVRDRLIVANPTPNIELILSLQPDLVVADGHLFKEESPSIKKLMENGVTVELLSINGLEDWKNEVMRLGNLFMEQSKASKEIDRLNAELGKPGLSPKPKVLVVTGGAQPYIAGTRSFQADVVKHAGGEPIGPDADEFVSTNLEQVAAWNPDIVFVTEDPSVYAANPIWSATQAGKTRGIININADFLLRPGARVTDLIGAMRNEMTKVVAPAGAGG
jgi:iron complex transport system substrate-binding protein